MRTQYVTRRVPGGIFALVSMLSIAASEDTRFEFQRLCVNDVPDNISLPAPASRKPVVSPAAQLQ